MRLLFKFICSTMFLLLGGLTAYSTQQKHSFPIQIVQGADCFEQLPPTFLSDRTGEKTYTLTIQKKAYSLSFQDGGFKPGWHSYNVKPAKKDKVLFLTDCFKIPVSLQGRSIDYQVRISNFGSEGEWLGLKCNTALKVVRGKSTLFFWDRNLNGRFNDIGIDLVCEKGEKPVPVSKLLSIELSGQGGKRELCEWRVVDGGQMMRFTPYTGSITNLKVIFKDSKDKVLRLDLVDSKQKSLINLRNKKTAVGRAGKYQIRQAVIQVMDKNGRYMTFAGGGLKGKPVIDIKPGDFSLALGPPFQLKSKIVKAGNDSIRIENVLLVGVAGEVYAAKAYSRKRRINSSLVVYQAVGDKKKKICKLEYG